MTTATVTNLDLHGEIRRELDEIPRLREQAREHRRLGEHHAALEIYSTIATKIHELLSWVPGERHPRLLDGLAGAEHGMAICCHKLGNKTEAAHHYENSEVIRRRLEKKHERKRNTKIGGRRAENLFNLGLVLNGTPNKQDEAYKAFRTACELYARELARGRLATQLIPNYIDCARSLAIMALKPGVDAKETRRAYNNLEKCTSAVSDLRIRLGNERLVNDFFQLREKLEAKLGLRRETIPLQLVHALAIGTGLTLVLPIHPDTKVAIVNLLAVIAIVCRTVFFPDTETAYRKRMCLSVCFGLALMMELGMPTWSQISLCCFWFLVPALRQLCFRWRPFAKWRERVLIRGELARTNRALARKLERTLPKLIRYLVIDCSGKTVSIRPFASHLIAECSEAVEILNSIELAIDNLIDCIESSIAEKPPDRRVFRREKNLSQPWAGRRMFCALLPRGVHDASAI